MRIPPLHFTRCILMTLLAIQAGCIAKPAPSPRSGFIPVADGLQLYYQVEGRGTTILVVHGGPGFSFAYMQPDLQELARTHRVIYYDQRGGGRSTISSHPALINLEKHIEDLETVRRHFGIEHLTLLGHSWGAGLAAQYAARYGQHVQRLILVDSMPPRKTPYYQQFSDQVTAWMDTPTRAEAERLGDALATADDPIAACHAFFALFLRGYMEDPRRPTDLQGDSCAGSPAAVRNQDTVYRLTIDPLGDWDWRPLLRSIRVPTLVIHGEHDPIPLESAREWASLLPDAHLAIVRQSGHFSYAEQPAQFYSALNEFLLTGRTSP